MKKYFYLLIGWATLIQACTTKGTNWDIDAYAPVAETTLDLSKLLGDENIQVNNDSSVWLNIDTKAYSFDMDTVTTIPAITKNYTYLWQWANFTLNPGSVLPTITIPVNMNLQDLELRQLRLKEGKLKLRVKSTAAEKLIFTYYIPAATKNNVYFTFTDTVPGLAAGQDTVYYERVFDVNGYDLSLSGPDGSSSNTFTAYVDVESDINDPGIPITTNQVVFSIDNDLIDIIPDYGKGYLGQYTFNQNNIITDLDFMKSIMSGVVDIEQLSLSLIIYNTIGADLRFKPVFVKGINTRNGSFLVLTHPSMGSTANINRAFETGSPLNPVTPTLYTYNFNSLNSNIEQVAELLPDQFEFTAEMKLNPYGNIGGYTDFYYYDSPPYIQLKAKAPLKFSISQLYFNDTLDNPFASLNILDQVNDGEFIVRVENKFPLEMKLQMYMLDGAGNITDSLMANDLIPAAPVDINNRVTTPVQADLVVPVSASKITLLKNADKVRLKAVFNTQPQLAGRLQMYIDYYLKIKLIADISYNIEL